MCTGGRSWSSPSTAPIFCEQPTPSSSRSVACASPLALCSRLTVWGDAAETEMLYEVTARCIFQQHQAPTSLR
jgi:hypothetical protein